MAGEIRDYDELETELAALGGEKINKEKNKFAKELVNPLKATAKLQDPKSDSFSLYKKLFGKKS